MLHNYNIRDVAACFPETSIIVIGDSIGRQIYFSMTRISDPFAPSLSEDGEKHADYNYTSNSGINFYFHWDPYLNSSRTLQTLKARGESQKRLLVLGSGLWYLRYSKLAGGVTVWEDNMKSLIDVIKSSKDTTDMVIILPVQEFIYSKLSTDRAETLTKTDIDGMNAILAGQVQKNTFLDHNSTEFSIYPRVVLPTILNGMLDPNETIDGLHFSRRIVEQQVNLLYNLRCNDALPKAAPHDRTCCYSYPTPSMVHLIVIFSAIAWAPLTQFWGQKLEGTARKLDKTTVNAAVTIGLSSALVYLSDRTGLWLKEHKQFDFWSFCLVLGVLGDGLFRLEKAERDLGFLNRQQTDEWKGWMQSRL